LLTIAYLALTILGCGYVLVSMFLGHADFGGDSHAGSEGGHGHDPGHGDVAASYGVQGDGHGATELADGVHAAPAFHFPFFSPLALAALFGSIGAWGLIATQGFDVSDPVSLAIAIPAALVTTYVVTFAAWRVMSGSRGSSQIRTSDLQGALAEVITPIPEGGMGEVAAMVDGQRFNNSAREADGKAVPRGTIVRVQALVGGTLIVQKKEG
jgi:membrane protein implicated in regulation of membrane protease activity